MAITLVWFICTTAINPSTILQPVELLISSIGKHPHPWFIYHPKLKPKQGFRVISPSIWQNTLSEEKINSETFYVTANDILLDKWLLLVAAAAWLAELAAVVLVELAYIVVAEALLASDTLEKLQVLEFL